MKSILSIAAIAATTLLPTALAQYLQYAIVNIESSHGGAGQDLTNLTVRIPLTQTYTNESALDEVSTLYLTGAHGVPYDSVTCSPWLYANGSGDAGLPFNSSSPSFLSTNTVPLGSIVCISTSISFAPPSGPPGGPEPLTSSSASRGNLTKTMTSKQHTMAATSTLVKTTSASGAEPSTVTSVVTGGGQSGPSETAGTNTASASAALTSGNAASGISLGSEFFGGLALAGFGIAFAL